MAFNMHRLKRSADEYDYIVTDGKVTITKYHGAGGDVVVPDTIERRTSGSDWFLSI